MVLILVEGLDNTGKTTLVSHLQDRYPQLTMRPSIGNKHDLNDIHMAAYDEAYKNMELILCDRSRLISEYVYNPILQARPIAYPYAVWMRYLALWTMKPQYVIYCWRPLEVLEQTLSEREQLPGVSEHLEELDNRYNEMMTMLDMLFEFTNNQAVMYYNFEVDHPALIYKEIDQYLERVKK